MVFDHVVNHNGIYYAAGEDVPVEQKTEKPSAPFVSADKDEMPKVETKKRGRPAKANKE